MMRWLLMCAAALTATACTQQITGTAVPNASETVGAPAPPVTAGTLLLGVERIRAITGGGDDLNIIPTMDTTSPVDIDPLVESGPPECALVFAETAVFGREWASFHKTTYQYPPESGIISEAAAIYADADRAGAEFRKLGSRLFTCSATDFGSIYLGETSDGESELHTRPAGDCGRDYRLVASALIEVTFCGFPDSVSEIVIANIVKKVPG